VEQIHIPGGVKLSSFIKPMLATAHEKPFNGEDWIFELKVDGWRAIAEVNSGNVKLYSRNGISFLKAFPKIHEALREIKLPVILDGEIVVEGKDGKVSFQALQNYGSSSKGNLMYYVFDCLWMDGHDLKNLPLIQRKELLKDLVGDSDNCIRYVDHVEDKGLDLFEHVKKFNLEGIVAKKANSKYSVNVRSRNWLKIKHKLTNEFVIVGMIDGEGSRQFFGGLMLAERKGSKFLYRGHVGSGFSDKQLKETFELLIPHQIQKPVVDHIPVKIKNPVKWLQPKYLCEVEYTELTEEEVLRHPVFKGLRFDKGI